MWQGASKVKNGKGLAQFLAEGAAQYTLAGAIFIRKCMNSNPYPAGHPGQLWM
jgi:hypothetical protein